VISLHRYRELFLVPEVRTALIASVVGRLPIGIAGLGILLFVQTRSHSFALAGTASALYILGLAGIAPFLGRFMDKLGPRPILVACGLAYPAALLAMAGMVLANASAAAVGAAAFIAGATLPPVSACIRALYPRLIAKSELLQTAYSVDSAVVELVFIVGPTIVAACTAVGHPEAAVFIAAISAGVGSGVFARARAVVQWSPAAHQSRALRGPLGKPGLRVVFAATVLYSIGFGLFEVGVTAHAAAMGAPSAAGIALAFASVGSGAGAVVYGSHHWEMPLQRQFLLALIAMAAGMLVLIAIDQLVLYSLAAILAGIPMATVIAAQSLLISRYATRERLAESFTWATTCLLGGVSAGIAVGGWMAEGLADYSLLVTAAGSTAISAMLVAACLKNA
jgi:MFS family permease